MEKHNNNILWIDYCKFIGIFLVIVCHSGINDFIFGYIQQFFMAMFFFISGYLYTNKGYGKNINKILWSLVIPYLIYQFTYLPLVLGNKILFHHFDILEVLKKCLLGIILGDTTNYTNYSFAYTVCGTCWFIMVIIQLRFIFNCIHLTKKNLIVLSLLSFIILKVLVYYKIDLYFCLDNTLMALPFFCLGYIAKDYYNNIFNICNKQKDIIIMLLYSILLFLIYKNNGYAKMSHATESLYYTKSLLIVYIGGFIGTFMMIHFSKLFNKTNDFIDTIAKNTLFIIFFHYFILFFINWIGITKLSIWHITTVINIILVFILSGFNLVLNYYAIKFLKNHAPVVLGKGLKNVSK